MSYEILSLVIQIAGLGSIVALIITYALDKRWKRTEAAYNFYDEFDDNIECRLAMFMLDYGKEDAEFEFKYNKDFNNILLGFYLARINIIPCSVNPFSRKKTCFFMQCSKWCPE